MLKASRFFRSLILVNLVAAVSACAVAQPPGPVYPEATGTLTATPLPPPTIATPTTALLPATATAASPTAATVAARGPLASSFPLATFEMTDADGRWTVTFAADRTFEVTLKGAVASRGTFEATEDRLTLHDMSGTKSCKGDRAEGSYGWALDGTVLKLRGIADNRVARAATLSSSAWTIQR